MGQVYDMRAELDEMYEIMFDMTLTDAIAATVCVSCKKSLTRDDIPCATEYLSFGFCVDCSTERRHHNQ